ncbi:MAG: pantoate--beta-alanine ligase [Chloroflexi bacterium]|nr:pantoate--beta-alanine ligase [Chloroflexota bacterium]
MRVVETVAEMRKVAGVAARPLGLVPTMGAVHEGHKALVRRARSENVSVVASLFVNPAQFGPTEDYVAYARDLDTDLSQFEAEGVDIVFVPSEDEVYPEGFGTYVDVGPVASRLEGELRSGHFRGVATVVCKLLAIVRPDMAYFGQKDAQQSVVIKRLNADLDLGAEIVVVPTVRDMDGLALSSRNVYLSPSERESALVLYRSLRLARELCEGGVTDAEKVRRRMRSMIEGEPGTRIDYVSIAHAETLEELETIAPPVLVSLAVRIGKTRLIDNVFLD